MPKRSGDEVVLAMQYMDEKHNLPTIMLTADATPQARQASLDAGVNEFLTKPLDSKDLLEKIARLTKSCNKNKSTKQTITKLSIRNEKEKLGIDNEWFDPQVFQSLMMLDTDSSFIEKLVNGFIKDGEKHINRIDIAVYDDYLELRESLHALKGSAAELGAKQLVDICRKGESYKPYDIGTDTLFQLSEDIKLIYNNTVTALNKEISKAVTADLENTVDSVKK
jgi:two-component system sensor histidine kinase RpfC